MGGSAVRNFDYFTKIFGKDFFSNIFVMTSHWNTVTSNEVERSKAVNREKELKGEDKFGPLLEFGTSYSRCYDADDVKAAIRVIHKLTREPKPEIVIDMLDNKKKFNETIVGQQVNKEMKELMIKHEEEMKILHVRLSEESSQRMKQLLEKEAVKTQKLIDKHNNDMQNLQEDFEEQRIKIEQERAKMVKLKNIKYLPITLYRKKKRKKTMIFLGGYC